MRVLAKHKGRTTGHADPETTEGFCADVRDRKTQELNFSGANLDGRPPACTSLFPFPLSLRPPTTAAVYARPNRIDTASSVSFRLMDRAARSPFPCDVGHVGVRARANASRCVRRLEVVVRRRAGALAASRQQSQGAAMCAGRVPVLL